MRRLIVAMHPFAPFVAFLSFQAQGGDGACVEAGEADRFAGFLAIAVRAIFDPPQRGVDLGDQLALPVAGPKLQGAI